ncbi:MAG: GTP 3',8-cyclase MoaA [Candidatus Omnitrophica bacterium]|nr:GTP 3',8-cyclase MoaA [Candidatus Omnitrophota bacterium]
MMRDKFGRKLTYLRVSLIDRCNLRCFYCMPKGPLHPLGEDEFLNMEETVAIISLFAELGISKVRLTGGEPLLKKGVPELVERVKGFPGMQEVVMTTNGVLLKHFAGDLKKAGLDRINVSLDTLDRDNFKRITGADKLNEVLEGIQAAGQAGIGPIKINAVLMKGVNDHEILDLVRFAVENAFQIRFIEWMPTASEIQSIRENRFLSAEFAQKAIEEKYSLMPDHSSPHAPARSFFIQGSASRVGFISPLSNAFCAQCNRLRLKANGMLKTCLHGKEDLDIRSLLRQGLSRESIKRQIASVVFDRPEEHFLNQPSVAHHDFVMTAVGG